MANEAQGLSDHELLLEIRESLSNFIENYHEDQKRQDEEISKRPTRGEIFSLLGGAGALMGIVFGLITLAG